MIQQESILDVADNSGAKKYYVFKLLVVLESVMQVLVMKLWQL